MNEPNESISSEISQKRRDFMKRSAAGIAAAIGGAGMSGCASLHAGSAGFRGSAPEKPFAAPPIDRVRIGYVGVGGMGTQHVKNLLRIEGVEIKAVCDIVEEHAVRSQKLTVEAGQQTPTLYTRGKTDFVRMCEQENLDLVYTATPWEWHVPVCVAAMKNGKHAATEVPAATTVDECWQLVEHAEKYKKHCVMMENCCYDRSELMVLNMVRQGLFGELLHCEAGYLHDLRDIDFSSGGEGLWRLAHSIKRDANLYPTHGLGPVSQCLDINRGDRYDYLTSMSTVSRGLNLYAAEKFGPNDLRATQKYALGDINVSMIHTAKGRTITLIHDCSSPRPYTRINLVQGTKGIYRKYPDKIHIEGRSPAHEWETIKEYINQYEHPLWKAISDRAQGGHGGMDFIEDYRLITCLRKGFPMDMDVYDAAAWSVITELSEISVAHKSTSVDVPDFTRGRWKTNPPLGIVTA